MKVVYSINQVLYKLLCYCDYGVYVSLFYTLIFSWWLTKWLALSKMGFNRFLSDINTELTPQASILTP